MLRASDMKTGPRGPQACVVAAIVGNRLAAEAQPRSCLTAAAPTEAQGRRGVAAPGW
jgi:hypothetical protein